MERDFYVVTEAKVIKVDPSLHRFTLERGPSRASCRVTGLDEVQVIGLNVEHLKGRRFHRDAPKLDVIIAWDSDLQDLLGVPIDAWEAQDKRLMDYMESYLKASSRLHALKNASWKTRFKWLFTGIKEID